MTAPERLPLERERDLVIAAEGGDREARRQLVDAFLPAIRGAARRYDGFSRVDRIELLQEGVAGLLTATGRFDPEMGTPFWAYASWWVRQSMQQLVAEVAGPVVLSDRAARALARVRDARREHYETHRREASIPELAAAAGLERTQVERLVACERVPRSLQEPMLADDQDGATLAEQLADPAGEEEYDRVLERADRPDVEGLLSACDEREREVLCARYGLGREVRTLREIGAALELSAERVRQIEQRALAKLRTAVAGSPSASPGSSEALRQSDAGL